MTVLPLILSFIEDRKHLIRSSILRFAHSFTPVEGEKSLNVVKSQVC